jgi:ribosomal-protein-alanine N-acetyltransferase
MEPGRAPTRLVRVSDAAALAALLRVNREFLAPWQPARADDYFTASGQRDIVAKQLEEHAAGRCVPHVIVGDDDTPVGWIALNGVVRGALQSASIAYWVDQSHTGRGLATAAVHAITRMAFDDLGLHRIQAETLPHNRSSQRVLERVGFRRYGVAPQYLKIAGRWQDCVLYQLLNPTPH